MQRSLPKYRINYRFCQQNGHVSEKANLVCLQKSCQQNPLICSFCIGEKHSGHSTKPLKHFLQNLQKKYSSSSKPDLDKQLEELKNQKYLFMNKIQTAVESLALSFQELQQEVLKQYQHIKNQILSKEINRNKFNEFYQKMAFQQKGDPNFQIQNYLNFQPVVSFNLTNEIEDLVIQTKKNLQEIKSRLVIKQNLDFIEIKNEPLVKITEEYEQKFVIPSLITRVGNVFSQKSMTNKQTVCYFTGFLKNWTGKLQLKVINLQPTSELTIGVASQKDLINSKHQFTFKNSLSSYYMNNKGQTYGNCINYITSIKSGDTILVMIRKNKLKISLKGAMCNFDLKHKEQSMFFFNLQGICEVQVIYPFSKEL